MIGDVLEDISYLYAAYDALDARVKELKEELAEHRKWHRVMGNDTKPKLPPTGPVLNDAKGRLDPDTHLPFITGLSKAKPNPDIFCSFCGGEHEYRNLCHGENGAICRACIDEAVAWKEDDSKPTPTDEDLVRKYANIIHITTDMGDSSFIRDLEQILRQLIAEVRS